MSVAALGVSIGALFHYARQASREAKMNEMRAITMARESRKRAIEEKMSREHNLQRMRSITQAQLGAHLARSGTPFGSYYGPAGSVGMSAHVSNAAAMTPISGGM